ncbi:putative mucin TcSMUGS [Trypanosoma cruzi]|uniref:Putative mucin TcSMUGS n=1 Tax=Trypanosoma cruzi TaxID=5693 RepID=A0A2V2UG09_TRYCR|nr:putative mucin TcSMUGS [Trypanosoma cruzi]
MYICHCLWLCVLGVSSAVCFAPGSSGCDHLLFWLPLRAGPVPPAVHSLRRPRADVHLLPPPRHLWGEASVRFYFYFYFFFWFVFVRTFSALTVCVRVCWCPCGVAWLLSRVSIQLPAVSVCVCVYAVHLPVSLPPMLRALVVPARCRPDRRVYTASNKRSPQGPSDNDAAPRPLRAFPCPLLCVRVRHGSGGGQYDVAVVEAGEGQDQTTTTTTHQHYYYYDDHHHHQCSQDHHLKAPTPGDGSGLGGPLWVQVPLLLLVSAAVATAGAAC